LFKRIANVIQKFQKANSKFQIKRESLFFCFFNF
jgi:hypothetical protein